MPKLERVGAKRLKRTSLTENEARRLRLSNLLLSEAPKARAVDSLLSELCGVQAQYPAAAELALSARTRNSSVAVVRRALNGTRSVVRTWCMRGTLHWLAADDLAWLTELHGSHFIAKSQRRYAELGLTQKVCEKGLRALESMLLPGVALTRKEIAAGLADHGVRLSGQAPYHLIRRAALAGTVCFGADREREPTYVATRSWVPVSKTRSRSDALAELARRYFGAFGPATVADFATWSGLPVEPLRAGIEAIAKELDAVDVGGRELLLHAAHAGAAAAKSVCLLPAYDPFWLGYRDRELSIATDAIPRVHPGGGLLRPILVIDGVTSGTWALKKIRAGLALQVSAFRKLTPDETALIAAEVDVIGRFLGESVSLRLC